MKRQRKKMTPQQVRTVIIAGAAAGLLVGVIAASTAGDNDAEQECLDYAVEQGYEPNQVIADICADEDRRSRVMDELAP